MIKEKVSFGSLQWGINTRGSLSSGEKFKLTLKAISIQIGEFFKMRKIPISVDVNNIQLPDSSLIQNTLAYIQEEHQLPLQNHCLRSFVIGEIFGQHEKLAYDKEILAMAALLHDLGLEEHHCALHKHIDCFAIEGALEAGKFLETQAGITSEKIQIVQDAIAYHLNIDIPEPAKEAYLLNKGTATDTIGLYLPDLSKDTVRELMGIFPRHNFNLEVHQMLKKQVKMRPKSRIAFLYQHGFGGRLKKIKFE